MADLGLPATYVSTPKGVYLMNRPDTAVYTLPLPEDVGENRYRSVPKMTYVWRSKKFVFPGHTTMAAAKVVHSCPDGLLQLKLYADGCLVYTGSVCDCMPFRLPAQLRGITWEVELTGKARITEVHIASSMRELIGQ